MADLTITAANIRLVSGPTIDGPADVALTLGNAVYVKSDGDLAKADADDATQVQAAGIVVSVPNSQLGLTACVAGDRVDIALPGAVVTGFSGLTPGALLYASTTAGAIADAAPAGSSGDYLWIIGRCLTATDVLVMCWTSDFAAQ